MNAQQQLILLVEDNEDDMFLFQRALQKAKLNIPVHVATDGQQALDYLSGSGKFSNGAEYPLPSLIFLDLKLPYVHGFDVLSWLRQQPQLKEIEVLILTSSSEQRDRQRASELRARAYLVKPPTPETLLQILGSLAHSPAVAAI